MVMMVMMVMDGRGDDEMDLDRVSQIVVVDILEA